ncbi:MAG: type II toxin-antitoxin system HipA family toxin [Angustibacter sp.]
MPRLIALPTLLRACDELGLGDDAAIAVKRLLSTGSTGLGGTRPKASVRLEGGALGLAKFPHASDQWDVMSWEATALDLLAAAGIRTPEHRLTRIGHRSVLILRRFDRCHPEGSRIGYISAWTAVGASDGEQRDYAEIAEAIRDLSHSPAADHHELFDRVTASIVLGNTDDHLRNHGFLTHRRAWRLSPAFDVNPNPNPGRSRSTTIMGGDTFPDEVDGLLTLAEECGLSPAQARARIGRVADALAHWREAARRNRIGEGEISMMADSIGPRLAAVHRRA